MFHDGEYITNEQMNDRKFLKLMSNAEMELPYEGAKEMLLVDDVDNREFLGELIRSMWEELPQFVRKTEKEVANSRQAVANGLTEEEQEEKTKRERRDSFALVYELPEWADPEDYIKLTGDKMLKYEVQEGDSLWRISECFYGTGYKRTTIVRTGAEAIRCSEELCPGGVSNLTFEKSHTEDGCDLYGYSFEYDTGEEDLSINMEG